MKIQSIIEDVLITSGIAVSMVDIHQILSIILLVFNVLWLLAKFGIKVYEHIKNKQYKEIAEDIKETKDGLEDLSHKVDSDKSKQ